MALWCTFDMVGVGVVLFLAACRSICSVDQLCSGHRVWLVWCKSVEKDQEVVNLKKHRTAH